MPNAADLAADEIRAFSVDLERFSADIRNRALEFLRKLEEELIALLRKHDLGEVTLTSAKQRRMEKLLEQTQATIATAYAGIRDEVKADLREVAALSAANAGGSINAAVGVDIATTALAPERIKAIVDSNLIQGQILRSWWSDQAATTLRLCVDQIQKGYASGEGVDAIVRRIRGSSKANYKDGVLEISKRNAETLVRTAVQSVSNNARTETFENNDDIIENLLWVSTLDGRTSQICKSRSGLQWTLVDKKPVGHSIPWNGGAPAHFRCRSVTVAVLKPLNDIPDRKAAKVKNAGMQSSMDGEVPSDLDYSEWLKTRKSVAFQKEVLGEGKWELWQSGKLELRDMLDMSGNPISLEELRRRYGGR